MSNIFSPLVRALKGYKTNPNLQIQGQTDKKNYHFDYKYRSF